MFAEITIRPIKAFSHILKKKSVFLRIIILIEFLLCKLEINKINCRSLGFTHLILIIR